MNVRGITITSTVLVAALLCGFYAKVMMLPHPTFRVDMTAVAHPSMYVTYLSAEKEASSFHVTTKCMTKSYTSLNDISSQHIYAEKSVIYKRFRITES